jgi:hypothetical protein
MSNKASELGNPFLPAVMGLFLCGRKIFGVLSSLSLIKVKSTNAAAAKVTANRRPCEESSIVMTLPRLACRMRG